MHAHTLPAENPARMRLMAPVDTGPLVSELDAHPELWNEWNARTSLYPNSAHRETDDIWLRYNAASNFDSANPAAFNARHQSVWYPGAFKTPRIRNFVYSFALRERAAHIGAVLVTRVPAGKRVHWHVDSGWHAESHRKFLILLRGTREQTFEFENETLAADAGTCFQFENEYPHRVMNPSSTERISLIICLRGFMKKGTA